jgi:hypothetical protein
MRISRYSMYLLSTISGNAIMCRAISLSGKVDVDVTKLNSKNLKTTY